MLSNSRQKVGHPNDVDTLSLVDRGCERSLFVVCARAIGRSCVSRFRNLFVLRAILHPHTHRQA